MKDKTDGTDYKDKRFAQTYRGLMAINIFSSLFCLLISIIIIYNPVTTPAGTMDRNKNGRFLIAMCFFFPLVMRQSSMNYEYLLERHLVDDKKYKGVLFYIMPFVCGVITLIVFVINFKSYFGL